MIYLLIAIFVLVSSLYLINMRETFYSSNCNPDMDQDVINSLIDLNRSLGSLESNIKPIELPCNL